MKYKVEEISFQMEDYQDYTNKVNAVCRDGWEIDETLFKKTYNTLNVEVHILRLKRK